jgi:hypothetical protein
MYDLDGPALLVFPPMTYFKPVDAPKPSVFLAGSIEMGKAVDWQAEAAERLEKTTSVIFNPRRPDFCPTWDQSILDPEFNAQVNWELDHIERADYVLFNFVGETMSPITLLELGFVSAKKPKQALVHCPQDFWRKGNVDIVCNRYGMRMVEDLDEAYDLIGYQAIW